MELLFESRTNLINFSGHLNFIQRQPELHPEPVLKPDTFADGAGVSIYGASDITLVYQPDAGGRWLHMPGRPIFIDRTAIPWARIAWINSASNVVEVGDEHRLFFSGTSASHCFGRTPDWKSIPRWLEYMKQRTQSGITFARWPKWQLFGFEADPEGAFAIQLGALDKPSEVFLSYEVIRPEGCIRAEVGVHSDAQVKPHTFKDSLPLARGSTNERITWKTGTVIQPTPAAWLFLRLENVRVYAYEVRPAQ